jgi:hypothetical protein
VSFRFRTASGAFLYCADSASQIIAVSECGGLPTRRYAGKKRAQSCVVLKSLPLNTLIAVLHKNHKAFKKLPKIN